MRDKRIQTGTNQRKTSSGKIRQYMIGNLQPITKRERVGRRAHDCNIHVGFCAPNAHPHFQTIDHSLHITRCAQPTHICTHMQSKTHLKTKEKLLKASDCPVNALLTKMRGNLKQRDTNLIEGVREQRCDAREPER